MVLEWADGGEREEVSMNGTLRGIFSLEGAPFSRWLMNTKMRWILSGGRGFDGGALSQIRWVRHLCEIMFDFMSRAVLSD